MPTYSNDFLICAAHMLREECGDEQKVGGPYNKKHGYSNDPHDTGGKTMMGILEREYIPWRNNRGLKSQTVKLISDDEINTIYHDDYWVPIHGDLMSPGMALVTFDAAVNCGVGMAIRKMQKVLGVTRDGVIGPKTLAALKQMPAKDYIMAFSYEREMYHRGCRTFAWHGKGWLDRTARIRRKALDMKVAPAPVIDEALVEIVKSSPELAKTQDAMAVTVVASGGGYVWNSNLDPKPASTGFIAATKRLFQWPPKPIGAKA